MKKLLSVFLVLMLAAGVAFAANTATVDQDGTGNDADVVQSGALNTADVDQFGKNLAKIDQVGGSGGLNTAVIEQGASGSPVTNFGTNLGGDWKYGAFINQNGSLNQAYIDMNSGSNGASIVQDGDDNYASQELNASISKTTSLTEMGLDIDQIGDENIATQKTVSSFGMHGIDGMDIYQYGSENTANQLSIGGAGTTMDIDQVGNNNGQDVNVSATGLDPLGLAWAHKPEGNFTQYQNAYLGVAYLNVTGDGNQTAQYQEYTVWAAGGDNDAWITLVGDLNHVAQGQLGEYNDSDVYVSGSSNVVATRQLGDSNIADIDIISGDFNTAGINQIGDGHNGSIQVNGMSNVASILQQP